MRTIEDILQGIDQDFALFDELQSTNRLQEIHIRNRAMLSTIRDLTLLVQDLQNEVASLRRETHG